MQSLAGNHLPSTPKGGTCQIAPPTDAFGWHVPGGAAEGRGELPTKPTESQSLMETLIANGNENKACFKNPACQKEMLLMQSRQAPTYHSSCVFAPPRLCVNAFPIRSLGVTGSHHLTYSCRNKKTPHHPALLFRVFTKPASGRMMPSEAKLAQSPFHFIQVRSESLDPILFLDFSHHFHCFLNGGL